MLNVLKDKSLRKLLILAILVRLLLMPFLYHPDIKTYNFQSSFLSAGVFNIYPYLLEHKAALPSKEEFVYFPLTYFLVGGYQILVSPLLGGNFHSWLFNANQTALALPDIFRFLFLLKLPYLFLDIAVAFLLMKFFDGEYEKKMAFTLWLLNPFSILIIYVFSNIDIIPVFLTVLSLLFAKQKKIILGALVLGIAAGFKAYPLLFVPFLLLWSNSWRERLGIIAASVGSFLVILAPFYSKALIDSAVSSGLTTRLFDGGLALGFGENIILTVFLIAGLFFYLFEKNREEIDLSAVYTVVTLIIFSFIHFHVQWLLWGMPFICLSLVRGRKSPSFFVMLFVLALLVPFLYDDKSMNVSIFSVMNPIYSTLPTPYEAIQRFYDPLVIQSLIHTIFAAGCMVVSFKLLKEKP